MSVAETTGQPVPTEGETEIPVHVSKSQRRRERKANPSAIPQNTKMDDAIMDTNNSSIVSKRSVEKLYYPGQQEYFRCFVRKFQRRSPLINRGYWLRMKAVDSVVKKFMTGDEGLKKIVVNLGCGYDPYPFEYLGRQPELCEDVTFVDVDYPQLMQKKYEMIKANALLNDLIPDLRLQPTGSTIIAKAEKYLAVGCDLRELERLETVLRTEFDMADRPVSILFTAEVSVAYMTLEASDAVLRWASRFDNVRFCLLEQQLPDGCDSPFAQTMLKHFTKLRSPLNAVGSIHEMYGRFTEAGWPASGIDIRSLWELWGDPEFLSPQQRMDLDQIEPFDEWEEFALFGSHYFLLEAQKMPGMSVERAPAPTENTQAQDVKEQAKYSCLPLQGRPSHRRFAAILPLVNETATPPVTVGLHGGLGTRERLNNCDTYCISDNADELKSPPLPTGLMCHTITPVISGHCLLVGGRTSPDKASAACWYRKDGTWSKVHDLPGGRYRHCAVAIQDIDDIDSGVVIFGGKNSRGDALADWLLWTPTSGWTSLESVGPGLRPRILKPRFGAAMTLLYEQAERGFLTGGMRQDGTIINDFWVFELRSVDRKLVVILENCTDPMKDGLQEHSSRLGRFGAAIVPTRTTMLLVGGVAADSLLTREHEILDLHSRKFIEIESEHRLLLTGFSALSLSNESKDSPSDILILGGGATCFSFGTYWNDGCVLRLGASKDSSSQWHLLAPADCTPAPQSARSTNDTITIPVSCSPTDQTSITGSLAAISVPRRTITSTADFELIRNESRPVILTGMNLGPCTNLWTNDYLKTNIGKDRQVVVHSSPTPHMNFRTKNFNYDTQPFSTFLDSASDGSHLYLRTLSTTSPSSKPTNLETDFPSIAPDFSIPEELEYVQENKHSSPLRISGPVTIWLHYDVKSNILCQIRGRKRILLFHPTSVTKLAFDAGASSSRLNPFTDSLSAQAHEALLAPGDVLFIPPLWPHCAELIEGLSVAVNVFFKDKSMESGYAAGRDVYGNRDFAAYERGRRDIEKIVRGFEGLGEDVRRFYLARLAEELRVLSLK